MPATTARCGGAPASCRAGIRISAGARRLPRQHGQARRSVTTAAARSSRRWRGCCGRPRCGPFCHGMGARAGRGLPAGSRLSVRRLSLDAAVRLDPVHQRERPGAGEDHERAVLAERIGLGAQMPDQLVGCGHDVHRGPPWARRRGASERPSRTPSFPASARRMRWAVSLSPGALSSAVYTITPASVQETVTASTDILALRSARTGIKEACGPAFLRLSCRCSILARWLVIIVPLTATGCSSPGWTVSPAGMPGGAG
jgi:hypothetical protein